MDAEEVGGRTVSKPPARRRGGVLLPLVGTLALGLLLAVGWLAWRGYQVQRELRAARDDVRGVEAAARGSDWARLHSTATSFERHADAARYAASDPLWTAASHLPWLGDDLAAVSTVSDALDHVATHALVPLTRSRTLAAAEKRGGGMPPLVEALGSDAALMQKAAAAVEVASAAVVGLDQGSLLGPVAKGVADTQDGLSRLSSLTSDAAIAAGVAPRLLGDEQDTTLLLVFQTPAEARGTGGLIGAWGEVHAHKGQLRLARFGANDELPVLASMPKEVNPQLQTIYGDDPRLEQNANLSASFPDAAALVSSMWSAGPGQGRLPDAVLSLDPVALGRLLHVVGSVTTSDGTVVTAENAADLLMRDAYYRFDNDLAGRITFLGDVTRAVFSRVTGAGVPASTLGRTLVDLSHDRRLTAWSPDPRSQAALERLEVSGSLGAPELGLARMALNNAEASKLQNFLKTSVELGCAAGGQVLKATYTSSVPATVPGYVGANLRGMTTTTMRLVTSFYVDPRHQVAELTVDGRRTKFALDDERSWTLVRFTVDLPRDGTSVVTLRLVGGSSPVSSVQVAPQVHPVEVVIHPCRANQAMD